MGDRMQLSSISGTARALESLLALPDRPWQDVADLGDDAEFEAYCVRLINPEFALTAKPSDILVGRCGGGYGHDLEYGAVAARRCGIAAVLCDECSPYFLRNAFHRGLIALEIPGVFAACPPGSAVKVDLDEARVVNMTTGWVAGFPPVPGFLREMVTATDLAQTVRLTDVH